MQKVIRLRTRREIRKEEGEKKEWRRERKGEARRNALGFIALSECLSYQNIEHQENKPIDKPSK